jgi:hypothetical protein
MGKGSPGKPFEPEDGRNKELVLKMLVYEDSLIHGKEAQEAYRAFRAFGHHSMDVERMTARQTLAHFGYDTGDESLKLYREINRLYRDEDGRLDPEIRASVTYLRANRLLDYVHPPLVLGQAFPDPLVHLYEPLIYSFDYHVLENPLRLSDVFDRTKDQRIIGAFSSS